MRINRMKSDLKDLIERRPNTNIHTYILRYIHILKYIYTHTYKYKYIYTLKYIHIHTFIYILYILKYIHIYN